MFSHKTHKVHKGVWGNAPVIKPSVPSVFSVAKNPSHKEHKVHIEYEQHGKDRAEFGKYNSVICISECEDEKCKSLICNSPEKIGYSPIIQLPDCGSRLTRGKGHLRFLI